ncbi:MAG: response regulator transcription factor [Pseudomonadota bacterium]
MTAIANLDPIHLVMIAPQMISWGLQQLVQSAGTRFVLGGVASNLASAPESLLAAHVDVVLVDLDDAVSPSQLGELASRTAARCVAFTASQDQAALDLAVLMGVRGIVRKSDPPQMLLRALQKVHEGELWLDRSATGRLFMEMVRRKSAQDDDPEAAKIATLTQRERQMIAALAADTASPGKVIASRLCISEHTLRNHLSSIYSKLTLSSRLDLYAFASRHKLDRLA